MTEISVGKKIDFKTYQEYLVEDERREEQNEIEDWPYIRQYEYYTFKDFNKFLELDIDEAVESRRIKSSISSSGKVKDISWNLLFQAYADYLKSNQDVSSGTAQNRFIYIRKYFKNVTLDSNITQQLETYINDAKDRLDSREYNTDPDFWEQNEVEAIFKTEWSPKYELMWRLMYRHARRVGEVQLVQWDRDIFIDEKVQLGRGSVDNNITSRNAIRYPKILKKKSDISFTLPLSDKMIDLLKQVDRKGEYLFQGDNGSPITQYTIREHLERVTEKCPDVKNISEIKNSSTHRFRHSRGVHMRQSGYESVQAQDLMQHSFASTTEDYYWSDLSEEEQESVFDSIFTDLDEEIADKDSM